MTVKESANEKESDDRATALPGLAPRKGRMASGQDDAHSSLTPNVGPVPTGPTIINGHDGPEM